MSDLLLVEKVCTVCGERKPLTEFYRCRSHRDGHHYDCKDCTKARVKARQQKQRERMGEEAWLEHCRNITARSRERTGNKRGLTYVRAQRRAAARLREAHRSHYDRLLAEELYEAERESA